MPASWRGTMIAMVLLIHIKEHTKKVIVMKWLLILLLMMYPLAASAKSDLDQLKQRYSEMTSQYESLRDSGRDVRAVESLVPEIQRSYKQRDKKKLAEQLDELERLLKVAASEAGAKDKPKTEINTASIVAKHEAVKLLIDAVKHHGYLDILNYRGSERGIDSQGALGRNKKEFSDVAVQRDAIWLAKRAILEDDPRYAAHVIKAIDYAFARQSKSGNFKNGLGVSAKKAVNADAFFLSSFAQIHYLFKNSRYQEDYFKKIAVYKPALAKAMVFLEKNQQELYRQDRNTANRLLFDAQAFILNGQILSDQKLIDVGMGFLGKALAQQRSDGTFNEHGGYDSSYQAVSILNLAQLWLYVEDDAVRERIYPALKSAMEWQKSRITKVGKVLVEGNARTGLGQEKFFGKIKEVNYAEVAMAFFYWAYISGDVDSAKVGGHIVDYLLSQRAG